MAAFVLLADDVAFYRTAEGGKHLKGSIQDVLDWYRDIDIAAEIRHQQKAPERQQQNAPHSSDGNSEAAHSAGKPMNAGEIAISEPLLLGVNRACTAEFLMQNSINRHRHRHSRQCME